ncbi:S8 family peptidase [Anaerocolumna chitinilytica]|uniref:Peptidase S8/S53 domain-containing protein n=1 Tax=Anaerocolumna chitinilytica TaxID=1727145 RepID=A0A7I8DKM0_9FIRM|nr:S8 family peptidase [Anaerocolumna chitinilytica]BCJ97831.1 hypothetical protein bsdcttw_08720 [Anaerocolumna chitinilytica]
MTEADRYKIISNDYTDILAEGYDKITNLINSNKTVNSINSNYAVYYLPASELTIDSTQKFGYQYIPKCYGLMNISSNEASGVSRVRSEPGLELRGQGVLVGFIDTGIEYTNPVFRYADDTTRIVSIWDQGIDSDKYPKDFYYGTEYSQLEINTALLANDPYRVVPSRDENGHGTMLAGIAAGGDAVDPLFSGVAPDTEIVVVKLKEAKQNIKDFFRIPSGVVCYQENDIMFGIQYLVNVAEQLDRPIAICIGVGSSQGAHEGEGVICHFLNDICKIPGKAIVVAGGNEGNTNHHYFGEINPSTDFDVVSLNIGSDEKGFTMELWGFAPNIVAVDVYAPEGSLVAKISGIFLQKSTQIVNYRGSTIYIDNQFSEERTGNQLIMVRFLNPISGVWRFVVSGSGDLMLRYHVWLPISNFLTAETYFLNGNKDTTLSIPANTLNALSISTYNHQNQSLYYYSGRGFTKSGGLKPDVAAPGVNLTAPSLENGFYDSTGSSESAAHTTGAIALLLEWGILRGNITKLNNILIRRIIINGARRFPTITYPEPGWGFGTLDIYRAIRKYYEDD